MDYKEKIWKSKKQWLIHVSSLDLMTQSETRDEAMFMLKDAVTQLLQYYFDFKEEDFRLQILDSKKSVIEVTSDKPHLLVDLSIKRQSEKTL